MSDSGLVSVIVIFLNAGRFIEEAIESVFSQTYDAWELLLIDDGSSDESSAIARRKAEEHPGKVRYLEHAGHQNRGMSASRNLGIQHARGEYIALLDADDVWLPQKLERQVSILSSQPQAAMVYGATQWWHSWTGKPEEGQRDFVHELGVPADTLLQPGVLLARFLRAEGISPCTCSTLIRREAAERVGGFEESFRGLYEDQAFFAKISLAAPVFVSSECLARYRQHPSSNYSLTQEMGQQDAARRVFLSWLAVYLGEKGIEDTAVIKAFRREVSPFRQLHLHRLTRYLRERIPGSAIQVERTAKYGWLSLPLVRHLRCLQFRRLKPLGSGQQRGTPIVRYYWDDYLRQHQVDIRGVALEIGTTATIRRWGGKSVIRTDAIDLSAHSPEVAVVADLCRADHVAPDSYDCFVNQFTMHLIHDVEAALYHSIRILKPGGVLLVNFPSVDYYFSRGLDMGTGAAQFLHWWFTPIQVENLLRRVGLTENDYQLSICGNLFTRIAYQLNMPAEELTRHELEYMDPGHPLLICVRVVKPIAWQVTKPDYREAWLPDTDPARWNPTTGHYAV